MADGTREPGEDEEAVPVDSIQWEIAPPPAKPTGAMLRCVCCGLFYKRGTFKCCAPPNGMDAGRWLELACRMPPDGCGKCWRHCACENKRDRMPAGPMREGLEKLAAQLGRR